MLGGYSAADYVATREWAALPTAPGSRCRCCGTRPWPGIPPRPGLVYGYGSYELSMDPGFGIAAAVAAGPRVVFVIAHIRGGGELGRHWYEDGKKLTRRTRSRTSWPPRTGWRLRLGCAYRIAAMGGSAGGLLMGAVANLAPEKYAAIVARCRSWTR